MVNSTGSKRIMCDPRVWQGVRGGSYSEKIARANLGVYKTLDDVPSLYLLSESIEQYRDRDIMREHVEAYRPDTGESTWNKKYDNVRRTVQDFLGDDGHYAFMTPGQVNSFFETRREYSIRNQYQVYLSVVRTLYDWLMLRTDYPHRYNPVDMAMLEGGAVAEIIEEWIAHKEIDQ